MPKKKIKTPKKEFEAVINKGTLWKTIVELMTNERITMHMSKAGMTIAHENKPLMSTQTEVCIIATLPAENFDHYVCPRSFSVSFDTEEHKNFIKSSKKKVKLTITIAHSDRNEDTTNRKIYDLTFTVTSPPSEGGMIPESNCVINCFEETPTEIVGPSPEHYRLPVSLPASSFSQIKLFSNQAQVRKISIKTQSHPSPYIGFSVGSGKISKTEKNFGKPNESVPNIRENDEGYLYCGECEKYFDKCKCPCELCEELPKDCECLCPCGEGAWLRECECRNFPYQIIERSYPLGALTKLTKLSGIQLSFYEPKDPGLPLKIKLPLAYAGSVLGDMQVFILDTEEIENKRKKKKK